MLEDRDKGVVYVPISTGLLPELGEWSGPVRFKVERIGTELSLVFEKLEMQPAAMSRSRAASPITKADAVDRSVAGRTIT